MRRHWFASLCWGLAGLLFASTLTVAAEQKQQGSERQSKFLRILKDNHDQPLALQTSIVRYKGTSSDGPSVDLIGAIHVGEKDYYERLNKEFQQYDAVLYELVAPEGQRVPERDRAASSNPVSALQVGVKGLLELEYQLDGINYRQPKLVHADLSPAEFAQSMADRGESVLQILFRALGQGIAMQSKDPAQSSDLQLLAALFSRNRALQLRRIVAQQLEQSLSMGRTLFDGPDGSTLVTVRNQRAMDVLDRELRLGKKRLAIFYGAAHLPDMHQRLLDRFKMKPVDERWLTAWSLVPPKDPE